MCIALVWMQVVYFGRRALGCARSKNLIDWEYLSVDRPMLDIRDVGRIVGEKNMPNQRWNRSGRLYAHGAIWHNNHFYLNVGGSIDGTNYTFILRSKSPMQGWEAVTTNSDTPRPLPIRIGGKWYRAQNTAASQGRDFGRAIALAVANDLGDAGTNHHLFDTGYPGSAGVSRTLFAYKGKWHIAYRQYDKEAEAEGNDRRNMYIARER